ncbi:MAG: MarR family winged helix-turn-helix transcriptional regulator [Stackebrandtia sp.]
MTTTDAELGLAPALIRLAHHVNHVFADASREHGITPQQAQLLCLLIAGPVGMTELSRTLRLEKSSLTGLVDRVERRGLVRRVRGDCDRRSYLVALTEQGTALADAAHAAVVARLETCAARLPQGDRDQLATIITGMFAEVPLQAAP